MYKAWNRQSLSWLETHNLPGSNDPCVIHGVHYAVQAMRARNGRPNEFEQNEQQWYEKARFVPNENDIQKFMEDIDTEFITDIGTVLQRAAQRGLCVSSDSAKNLIDKIMGNQRAYELLKANDLDTLNNITHTSAAPNSTDAHESVLPRPVYAQKPNLNEPLPVSLIGATDTTVLLNPLSAAPAASAPKEPEKKRKRKPKTQEQLERQRITNRARNEAKGTSRPNTWKVEE